MTKACVIGWPIAHSRSPLIHGYWLRKYGIDGAYTKEPVKPEELGGFLATLKDRGFAGCNVTVPHKEAAFAAAVIKSQSAIAVGAANTLWFEGQDLACANTDTYGFIANLDQCAPRWKETDGAALVLGAGGSARGVVYGLLDRGCHDIRVFNRTIERAEEIARHFGAAVSAWSWDVRNDHVAQASVIVNTTIIGMNGKGDPEIDFKLAKLGPVVADLVYVPLETPLLRSARTHGLVGVDGLGMLLHQAVPGFEKWFGVRPEVSSELYALVAENIREA
ncbi:shikimate dehydrogenase [Hyphomicrobium sp.]|uniref:shikimate dehydrogenase n=1 Tax=Hyphomicrobium sp. TaxID=82 RepID=UPI000FA4E855|nr:shikimate dehydrogenase [Hyphomicrobium sp.]RUP00268.1 MAG: shikimate dehydrogenase [Hyphomicrobium sp.]